MRNFESVTELPYPAETVFAWHERRGAFQRLSPPWERLRVLEEQGIGDGARTILETAIGPVPTRWVAEHRRNGDPLAFEDRQVRGPFAHWVHRHAVEPRGAGACALVDRIEYALPAGGLGEALGGGYVRHRLERTFAYRGRVLRQDLARHAETPTALRVAVSGASGLVGGALSAFLTSGGHEVLPLVRRAPRERRELSWNPDRGLVDPHALEGVDAVVHLAGENIASGRWTAARKRAIRDSRVDGTSHLARDLAALERKPRVLVCASAIGFYGDRPGEMLTESSAPGEGFLAETCRAWEAACEPAREAGIRVVNLRIGVVLSPAGGALAKMLPPFRLGLGGPLGNGRQHMSWVTVDDLVGAVHHALLHEELAGPVNAVAPRSVTNREFTRTLARVLRRPAFAPVPRLAARAAFGEMADELLFASADVVPRALEQTGFRHDHPELEEALRHVLGC